YAEAGDALHAAAAASSSVPGGAGTCRPSAGRFSIAPIVADDQCARAPESDHGLQRSDQWIERGASQPRPGATAPGDERGEGDRGSSQTDDPAWRQGR